MLELQAQQPIEPTQVAYSFTDLHSSFRHLGKQSLKCLVKYQHELSTVPIQSADCDVCIQGKLKPWSRKKLRKAKFPLQRLQSDISGPHPATSSGYSYHQVLVDSFSSYISVEPLKVKSTAPDIIKREVQALEKQTDRTVKQIRTDGAAEFNSKVYTDWLAEKGIAKQSSAPYTQSQNGLAEQAIQTLNTMISCMLIQSGLPVTFWAEAVSYSAVVINTVPKVRQSKSPYHIMFNKKFLIHMIHPFSCEAWAYIPAAKRRKFAPKAEKCIFLGIQCGYAAYCLL
jgi:hypothetical protein